MDQKKNNMNPFIPKKGFTLIELMITLAIIGIITTFTYPSYLHWILKSHRTEAQIALIQTQMILEGCYLKHHSYLKKCNSLDSLTKISTQTHYAITLSQLSRTTYTLTAKAIGSQIKDTACTEFKVNEHNVKTTMNSLGLQAEHCWLS